MKISTKEFIKELHQTLKERYNRYSNGSKGGANKRKKKRRNG